MTGRPDQAGQVEEAQAFISTHPGVRFVEIIFTGLNGVSRGKRLRIHELEPIYRQGRFLPTSTLVADITGRDVEESGLVWDNGDADVVGWPVPGSLVLAPWLGADVAQVTVTLHDLDGTPSDLDPRQVLAKVVSRFAADGLTPVLACELEYYLVDMRRTADGGVQLLPDPRTGAQPWGHNTYGLRELDDNGEFLRDLWAGADAQGIPLEGAISEYAPGQIELTLKHQPDALRAADQAVLYKRLAKGTALRHRAEATFMAKPFAELSGSGLHVHVSVNDADGRNIFASPLDAVAETLKHAIGGMRMLAGSSMAIFAPNANSYRRFRANSYAPVSSAWGVNNRTVPFRIPAGGDAGRHVEHRIAGADAHPYLATAAILAAVHYGMANAVDPGPAVTGNGYADDAPADAIPTDWLEAIRAFERDSVLADYLGERFVRMYAMVKRAEYARFNEVVTALDYDWYLRTA